MAAGRRPWPGRSNEKELDERLDSFDSSETFQTGAPIAMSRPVGPVPPRQGGKRKGTVEAIPWLKWQENETLFFAMSSIEP